ncbi:MAG: alpha/beta hydrolase-fold protein [Erysipelotrichaceae bacterium]|nr:alpha/beta hydrolase-fold protein [Erysipelotrichaceae bacterium]
MKIEYFKEYSQCLNRDMEFKVYGHKGKPCLVFPAQDGRFYDYENFHMIDVIAPFIEAGKIQLFCVDSVDKESWSAIGADSRRRIEQQERFYHYITDEFVMRAQEINRIANGDDHVQPMLTTGCSMGATHAANFFFRRPDLFDSVISLSGVYSAGFFFHDYMDDLVYQNSTLNYLQDMPLDHPWLNYYRNSKMIFCVGRGRWEEAMIHSMDRLHQVLLSKGVDNAWFDYWGLDVDHDWPWWQKQIVYFLDKLL